MEKVIFIGAGQYAKVVASSLQKKYKLVGFIDEGKVGKFLEKPIFGCTLDSVKKPTKYKYFVSLGEVEPREKWFNILKKRNLEVINVIDKSAKIAKDVKFGIGNYFGKNVVINNGTVIGDNNMFNTNCLIEHHCKIGSHIRVAPCVAMCGVVTVGDKAYLGCNSTFIGCQKIGVHSIIGAGSVVLKDVENYKTVVGVPSRIIKEDNRI